MPLTPADIHNIEFAKAAIGRRGYDEEQVDALLDDVTLEMVRLLEENAVLRDKVRVEPDRTAVIDVSAAGEVALNVAIGELNRARRDADQAEEVARTLRRKLDEARRAAAEKAATPPPAPVDERVMSMAKRAADDHMRDAESEVEAMLAEARERSERVTREALRAAVDIEQDAKRRDDQARAELQTRRADLVREVDQLSNFVVDYRAALEQHVARQITYLEDPAG